MDVREKLVELLAEKCMATCRERGLNVCSVEHCNKHKEECTGYYADHLIAHGVTVQEWISVKDKLPQECPHPYDDMTKAVLIYTPVDGYTHIGWYAGKDYRGRDVWKTLSAMRSYQTCTKKVSHWCCLPQPPKGE